LLHSFPTRRSSDLGQRLPARAPVLVQPQVLPRVAPSLPVRRAAERPAPRRPRLPARGAAPRPARAVGQARAARPAGRVTLSRMAQPAPRTLSRLSEIA